ncbi:MAG: TlpA disulfide reductase family protein [Planctomycetota bacterium]|nr:TlpA disulfide reductase family protein [Planctomycetota bacterium]
MSPHLVKWDKAYRGRGLTIIDVNNGGIDKRAALEKYVKKQKKPYPTLWDKGGKVCQAYAVRGYPAAFLIGVDGKVVWEGFPVPELASLERLITKELAKVAKASPEKVTGEKPGKGVRKEAKSGTSGRPKSKPKSGTTGK